MAALQRSRTNTAVTLIWKAKFEGQSWTLRIFKSPVGAEEAAHIVPWPKKAANRSNHEQDHDLSNRRSQSSSIVISEDPYVRGHRCCSRNSEHGGIGLKSPRGGSEGRYGVAANHGFTGPRIFGSCSPSSVRFRSRCYSKVIGRGAPVGGGE